MPSLRAQLNQRRVDKIPAGWLTRDQLAEDQGLAIGSGTLTVVIRDSKRAGLIEERKFRTLWGDTVRPRPHFRYTKKAR